jgi:hypothetical protein
MCPVHGPGVEIGATKLGRSEMTGLEKCVVFARRVLVPAVLVVVMLSCVGCAHVIKVIPTPSDSDVALDGQPIGHGVTQVRLIDKSSRYEVSIDPPPGYFQKKTQVSFATPRTLSLHAEKDHSYFETVKANDVVNKWIALPVNPKYSKEEAWLKLLSSASGAIADFEVLDQKSLYMKSAWKVAGHRGDYLRTRSRIIVSIYNPDPDDFSFKFRIEAERVNTRGDVVEVIDRTFAAFIDALRTARARLKE